MLTGTCPAKLIPLSLQESLAEETTQPQGPPPVGGRRGRGGGACRRHFSVSSSGSPGIGPCGRGEPVRPSTLPEELGLPGASLSPCPCPQSELAWFLGLMPSRPRAHKGKWPHLRAAELGSSSLSGCPLESSGSFKNDPRQVSPKTTVLPAPPAPLPPWLKMTKVHSLRECTALQGGRRREGKRTPQKPILAGTVPLAPSRAPCSGPLRS